MTRSQLWSFPWRTTPGSLLPRDTNGMQLEFSWSFYALLCQVRGVLPGSSFYKIFFFFKQIPPPFINPDSNINSSSTIYNTSRLLPLITVLCTFLNIHMLRLYSAPSDDGKAYFAKFVCLAGLLLAECACLALPLDQANSKCILIMLCVCVCARAHVC